MILPALVLALVAPQDTIRYAFDSKIDQDVTSPEAPLQNTLTLRGWLSVVMRDTAGGRIAVVIIDSSAAEASNAMIPLDMLKIPNGLTLRLHVVDGEIVDTDMAEPTMGSIQGMGIVALLFSAPKSDGAVGHAWADTVVVDSTVAGGTMHVRTVNNWKLVARDGDVMTVEGSTDGNMTGDMGGGGMTAKTTGTTTLSSTAHGPVRQLDTVTSTNMDMIMGEMTINMKQTQTLRIRRL